VRPSDLRNKARKSGYNFVAKVGGQPSRGNSVTYYTAYVDGPEGRRYFPARRSAVRAAQDYCDYANKVGLIPKTPPLKTANHPKAQRASTDIERVAVAAKSKARRKGLKGHVYLVMEQGNKRAVKIGHTFQQPPQARLNGLQTGNPRLLIMLAAKKGTEADESALHTKYIAHNILGEWFRPTVALLSEFGLKKEDLA